MLELNYLLINMLSKSKVNEIIKDVFYNVQFNKTSHRNYMKKLNKCYEKCDSDVFWEFFSKYLTVPLTMGQRHPRIENTLEFAAKFAVSFFCTLTDDKTTDTMCPFLEKLFNFLLSHHNAKDSAARYRICHFLNMLLNSMGEDAFIDDALCDKITVNMMNRLLDKSPKVRAQAVLALHRLQDPSDEDCPVIKMYIFHLLKDPKAEVRKAVLASMGKNQRTLQAALQRTRDIDDTVRKMAYNFISRITVRSLTIRQRDQLLNDGLKDRSDSVVKCVQNVLLPAWLRHFKGEYINLITALDAEMTTDAVILALKTLFKNASVKSLLDQTPVDCNTRVIPMEKLSSENTLYWRCVIEHLQQESCTEELETITPELSKFCDYIYEFLEKISTKQCGTITELSYKFILLQFFEIIKTYDLSDEVGRSNLTKLILHTLTVDYCSKEITACIVKQLEKVVPDVNARLNALANVISELRIPSKQVNTPITQISETQLHENKMQKAKLTVQLLELQEEEYQAIQQKDYLKAEKLKENITALKEKINKLAEMQAQETPVVVNEVFEEKNDPETMTKCLTIMCTMMQATSITNLTPTLMSLMELAFSSLDHANDDVHILALKAVGIYCILDKELAKKHIMTFFLQFSLEQENQQIWCMALKAIFDLLLYYGLEYFDIAQTDDLTTCDRSEKSRVKLYTNSDEEISDVISHTQPETQSRDYNFVQILTGLLDNENPELRTIAAEGLAKLLLNQRITGSGLVSRLIILCYNPANDGDVHLRQCLCNFFRHYALGVPEAQETLEAAFLPTLRVISNAPEFSPLQEIDEYDVAKFMLNLTRNGISKSNTVNYNSHNNLAFTILSEILDPNSVIEKEALIKSLRDLDVHIEDEATKKNLQEAVEKIVDVVLETDKYLLKYVERLRATLDVSDMPNTVVEEEKADESDNDIN